MAARLVVVVVVVVLVACVGSVLTAAVSSTGQGDKNSFDTWTREDPWNEVVDKIMKEEFPLGGTDGREGVNPRGKLRAWSKTQMFLESMTRISSPTADRDKQVTEKLVLSWARKWNDMEGKFLASEGSFSKTIKLGPIKNCCELFRIQKYILGNPECVLYCRTCTYGLSILLVHGDLVYQQYMHIEQRCVLPD